MAGAWWLVPGCCCDLCLSPKLHTATLEGLGFGVALPALGFGEKGFSICGFQGWGFGGKP